MKTRALLVLVISIFFAGLPPARAQKIAPPPKPDDDGPSLEVTMKFIQDGLNGMKFSYTHDGDSQTREITTARADVGSCRLELHERLGVPPLTFHYDFKLSFKDVAKLEVKSLNAEQREKDSKSYFSPDVYQLLISAAVGKRFHSRSHWEGRLGNSKSKNNKTDEPTDSDLPKLGILFQDEALANRMARAMVRAVELCSVGNKDLF